MITLGSCGIIVDPCGKSIKWEYVKSSHRLQKDEGLHLGNKLRSAHIDWQSCEPTCKFLETFDRLFDLMNF